ncbi:MAG: hypothetical protein QJR01_05315 [Kyrpidia sp.]|nr:hypothetical protein [Kyrpidia sp.]
MKKSLLYSALALAVVGGGTAAAAAVAAPLGVAAAADTSTSTGSGAATPAAHHARPGGGILGTAAQVLQVTPQELLQDLRSGQSIAQVAQSKGVSEQQVIDAIVQKLSASVDQRVQNGKLTQDKANQIKANLPDQVKKMVEHTGPWNKSGHPLARVGIAQVASILGMTPQDLMTQLKSGQSIADVAQSKGISEAQLIDQLLAKEKDALTKFVEHKWGGKKTPDQASGSGPASQTPAPSSNSGQESGSTTSSTL